LFPSKKGGGEGCRVRGTPPPREAASPQEGKSNDRRLTVWFEREKKGRPSRKERITTKARKASLPFLPERGGEEGGKKDPRLLWGPRKKGVRGKQVTKGPQLSTKGLLPLSQEEGKKKNPSIIQGERTQMQENERGLLTSLKGKGGGNESLYSGRGSCDQFSLCPKGKKKDGPSERKEGGGRGSHESEGIRVPFSSGG